MGMEIERKFLVRPGWKPQSTGTSFMQGYLYAGVDGPTVRVRVAGHKAFLTIKGPAEGLARLEYEYAIPPDDAHHMLKSLAGGRVIEKIRYLVEHAGHTWEVDVFAGRNSGLVVAEVEIAHPDEPVVLPDWVAEEVSFDHRYANAYLSLHPWSEWKNDRGKH
jgi:CYTH domain-containing protein